MNPYDSLLKQLNLPQLTFLGEGMQCSVFADGPERAVKIYPAEMGLKNLQRLMAFYTSLDTHEVSFQLPEILDISERQDKIIVTEKRLRGISPTRELLSQMPASELETYFQHYVAALFEIQHISTTFLHPAEPLDMSGDFYQYDRYQDWKHLLTTNLYHKLDHSGQRYRPFIAEFDWLTRKIFEEVKLLDIKNYRLIHGDYFPANSMMDKHFNITAILDFGTFTILGDPLYDIALSWIFADMYHNVKHFPIKDFVGNLILEQLNDADWRRMKLYILTYCILSADMYGSADVNDGHFRWAMRNLNDESLREIL